MSVRTVRVSDGIGTAHIKLALEVQLTGAVRGISESAVKAPLISSVLDSIMSLDSGFVPAHQTMSLGLTLFEIKLRLGGLQT